MQEHMQEKDQRGQETGNKVYKALDVREDFIKFFRQNQHKLLMPSKVFNNDPTLLFVNAGMNQLKEEFLKVVASADEKEEKFRKLCNSQICIRAGGKHNDLDDVGLDSYHLTSFEMLGHWSINSYQKEEAIRLAFTYLIEHLGLDKARLYVTYFQGDEKEGLDSDDETKNIWLKYLPESHIVKGNFKDNFWMMADIGVCGICTELHYDLIEPNVGEDVRLVPELVNADDPTLIEIWNNVFIQYERKFDSSIKMYFYNKLDRFFVDGGMGLERLCMVLQKKSSIYTTDVFNFLIGYAKAMSNCGHTYTDCYEPHSINYNIDCAYRIFCDHFRTIVIALFDGVDFDGSGRGHVLRKIFRRLMTYFYLYLNNGVIEQTMNRPIVLGVITDILNYHLKKVHDNVAIREKLIAEEKLFCGSLQNIKNNMIDVLETNDIDGSFDYVLMKNDPNNKIIPNKVNKEFNEKNIVTAEKMYSRLIKNGVPPLLVKHSKHLKIKPFKH